jgi:O-antigen/teichoic acid export membrane protein
MEKRKISALYVVLSCLGLLLFNYPIIHVFQKIKWNGIPGILFYFCLVSVFIVIAGFLITRFKEE